jgi:hypothetical protein
MKGFFKKLKHKFETNNQSQTVKARVENRISTIRRKMSRGASNIFRMIKSRCGWGNKQLWGFREKGRGKK